MYGIVYTPTATMYVFDATVVLWLMVRAYRAHRQTGNMYSQMMYRMAAGVAAALYIFGFSHLYLNEQEVALGVLFVLADVPLFAGLIYGVKLVFNVLNKKKLEFWFPMVLSILSAIYIVYRLVYLPNIYSISGVIFFDESIQVKVAFILLLATMTFLPGVFFVTSKVYGLKNRIKKFLIGLSMFVAGGGALLAPLNDSFLVTQISHIIVFLGFVILASSFVFDILYRGKKALQPSEQEVITPSSNTL